MHGTSLPGLLGGTPGLGAAAEGPDGLFGDDAVGAALVGAGIRTALNRLGLLTCWRVPSAGNCDELHSAIGVNCPPAGFAAGSITTNHRSSAPMFVM